MKTRIAATARWTNGMVALALVALGAGCDGGAPVDPDVTAGVTAIVAIVNPVVNAAHNTGVPASLGTDRDGFVVNADPGGDDVTEDGIGVVATEVGGVDLYVGDAVLPVTVQAPGDVYDAPVALSGADAAFFDATPIRYPVGQESGAVFFAPDAPLSDIEARLAEDDRVVVLGPGTYTGSLIITGKGVLLFGEGWTEGAVIIDGSISADGEEVRLRGLTITGDLAAKGNNFGISFSTVLGQTNITGNAGAFVRNVFCGSATVPSSNATLLDNYGVEPITAPPEGACDSPLP
jgi:hypothetical protein